MSRIVRLGRRSKLRNIHFGIALGFSQAWWLAHWGLADWVSIVALVYLGFSITRDWNEQRGWGKRKPRRSTERQSKQGNPGVEETARIIMRVLYYGPNCCMGLVRDVLVLSRHGVAVLPRRVTQALNDLHASRMVAIDREEKQPRAPDAECLPPPMIFYRLTKSGIERAKALFHSAPKDGIEWPEFFVPGGEIGGKR